MSMVLILEADDSNVNMNLQKRCMTIFSKRDNQRIHQSTERDVENVLHAYFFYGKTFLN